MLGALARRLFGSANDRYIKSLQPLVDAINELELSSEQAEQLVTEYHGESRPRELARARLWSLMSKYGWCLWGSIRIGATRDPEIIEWARALWERAVWEFESPEFEELLARAAE